MSRATGLSDEMEIKASCCHVHALCLSCARPNPGKVTGLPNRTSTFLTRMWVRTLIGMLGAKSVLADQEVREVYEQAAVNKPDRLR